MPASNPASPTLRVLLAVVEPDAAIIKDLLIREQAQGVVCPEVHELCRQIHSADAAIVLEEMLAQGGLQQLAEALDQQPEWSELPVLVVARGGLESPLAVQAMQSLRNALLLDRPIKLAAFTSAMRMALRTRSRQYQTRDLLVSLALNEARYRSFVEATAHVVWRTRAGGEVDQPIPSWNAFTGQTDQETAGFGWMNAVHPDDRRQVAEAWRRASAEVALYQAEYRLKTADGNWRRVLARGVPVLEPDGTVREFIGTCIDITARKRAELELSAVRDELAAELAAMNRLHELATRFLREEDLDILLGGLVEAAMASVGAQMGHVHLLDASTGELPIAAQRGLDQGFLKYFSRTRPGQIACGSALQTSQRVVVEDVAQSPLFLADPQALQLKLASRIRAMVCTPLVARAGHSIGVLSIDFTQPHRPSERDLRLLDLFAHQAADFILRKQAERALKRQALHLQLLHQAAARLLVGQQPVELLRQLHPQIARAFGAEAFMLYQADQANGEGPDRLHLLACAGVTEEEQHKLETLRYGRAICARPAEALQPIIATHLQTREAPNHRFVRKLGFRSYLYYPLILNNHLHGTVAFASRTRDDYDRADLDFFHTIAGTLAEALERQRLEAELQRHAADLERKVRERTAKLRDTIAELEGFSYSLAHDLRAPLRTMLSFAGILEMETGPRLQPDEAELLRKIKTAAQRMDQLVTDSLNYSKILRQELPIQPVNLGALLRGMVETYPNLQPPEADVTIELGDLFVQGNEATLTQIFSNLLGNAVKFVAPGVRPKVRVWAEPPSPSTIKPPPSTNRVLVWVQDNGIGIPKEAHAKIFGMFQRMHRPDEYPGTGIGLAIVRKALERVGGQICLDSEPGQGSRFVVELPLAEPATTAQQAA